LLFISPHPQYQLVGIKKARDVHHPASGKYLHTEPGIYAEFFHGGAPHWAIEQALAHPPFQAKWQGLPDGTPLHAYVSSYDTDEQARVNQWDAETKQHVEEFMLNHPDYGDRYIKAVPVEETLDAPWATYDKTHHFQVAKIVKDLEIDPVYVLAYEKANGNRPSVVKALEELVPAEEYVAA
jgi:hypothetical protein